MSTEVQFHRVVSAKVERAYFPPSGVSGNFYTWRITAINDTGEEVQVTLFSTEEIEIEEPQP